MTLQHLDSAIAFAVIMLGASLLITVLTQTISTLLNMRGKDLQRAICDLMTTLHPEEANKAEQLAREILRHPLLSESRFGSLGKLLQSQRKLLTLAVGALMLAATAACALLHCSSTAVALAAVVGALATWIANQASQSAGLASALRIEEFREMIQLTSARGEGGSKEVAKAVSRALSAGESAEARLTQLQGLTQMGRESMDKLAKILRGDGGDKVLAQLVDVALAGVGTPEQRQEGLAALKKSLDPAMHAAADKLKALADAELELEGKVAALAAQAEATVEVKLNELEILFNAAMDRASQRFSAHSRLWTIGFSIALAFLMHLDAIALFKQLSSDAELRAKLVASSDAMMKQADKILSPPPAASTTKAAEAPPEDEQVACFKLAKEHGRVPQGVSLTATVPTIYTAALLCPKAVDNLPPGALGPFPTREDAIEYIEKRSSKDAAAGLETYGQNLSALLQGSPTDQLFDNAASINGQLSRAGIDLLPEPYELRLPSKRELPGVLAAAAMLSLGAPFWFNLLKTMTNLRPLVATREQHDREAKAKAKVKTATS